MIRLPKTINAWGTESFNDVLKVELQSFDAKLLPLQKGLSQGSYVNDDNFSVMIIRAAEESNFLKVKVGVFYTSIIAGCSCADDPTPTDVETEYCELRLDINKETAEVVITLLD